MRNSIEISRSVPDVVQKALDDGHIRISSGRCNSVIAQSPYEEGVAYAQLIRRGRTFYLRAAGETSDMAVQQLLSQGQLFQYSQKREKPILSIFEKK